MLGPQIFRYEEALLSGRLGSSSHRVHFTLTSAGIRGVNSSRESKEPLGKSVARSDVQPTFYCDDRRTRGQRQVIGQPRSRQARRLVVGFDRSILPRSRLHRARDEV